MREFEIDVRKSADAEPDAAAGLAIGSGATVFTRLIRQGASTPQDHLMAPPGQLAFWLVDNWWRIRSECVPPSGPNSEWRLAHDLSSIGGYAWPRISIWGEGDRIGLSSRRDPAGVVGPVRYLTDALIYVAASAFEVEVASFLDLVASEGQGLASDWAALRAQIEALNSERSDPELTAWRRLEAQLGYDVDEVPETLMTALSAFEQEYGAAAVAEAALATQGAEAAAVLEAEIAAAKDHHFRCDLRKAADLVGTLQGKPGDPPWRLGEIAAAALLEAIGHKSGPVSNSALAEILQVRRSALNKTSSGAKRNLAYGLRLSNERQDLVALSSQWLEARRFEFCRALGDAIWSAGERLGPLTRAKSERQKFQRAFAQSLLCPYDALVNYIGDDVSDGALASAARHFLVNERLIRSVLVNKRQLDRERLVSFPAAPPALVFESSAAGFDEILEAG